MALRVLLFGALAEAAGWREKELQSAPASVMKLREQLARDDPAAAAALRRPGVRVAIDCVLAFGDAEIPAGAEEIAFMPVMSGG